MLLRLLLLCPSYKGRGKKVIKIYRQVCCAPPSLPRRAAALAMPGLFLTPSPLERIGASGQGQRLCDLFPRWCGEVTLEAEGRGSAVRDGPFVVAFVAGVLPFSVKA